MGTIFTSENASATKKIGLIGLAVMGENLALNLARSGFSTIVYNRTTSKVDEFVSGRGAEFQIDGAHELDAFCKALERPRKVIIMVKAGGAVDAVINGLLPYLEKGDILIDGGNSHFEDSERRYQELSSKGIRFVGAGISGGEEGALNGPSIMPGGDPAAWPEVKDILQTISAKAGDNEPCCNWVGKGGAGHFVKMVHNGIEYGDMQLLAEAYSFLKLVCGCSNDELGEIFTKWDNGALDSFLVEITAEIFKKKDNGEEVIDVILDAAGQKGTGRWTVVSALEAGDPLTLVGEAVFARTLSSLKEERVNAEELYGQKSFDSKSKSDFTDKLENALYCAKVISYAQGFSLINRVSEDKGWEINSALVARLWREGCIIRSAFLDDVAKAFEENIPNLVMSSYFEKRLKERSGDWREVVSNFVLQAVPCPAMASALAYFDGYTSAKLPANLIQAQRDFFGAHTYERLDKERGKFFHTNWTGHGGSTSSSSYNA